jgi:hypothetical protein
MASAHTAGSAASFADLQSAIETFLTSHGWAAAAGPAAGGGFNAQRLWTKAALVVRVSVATDNTAIHFRGATGTGSGTSTGDAPDSVKMASATTAGPMVFPIDYEIFWNDTPEEVYVVISYNGNKYQHVHFGASDVPEIGGTGMHIGGTYTGTRGTTGADAQRLYLNAGSDSNGGADYQIVSFGGIQLGFWQHGPSPEAGASFIHCGLEGTSWKYQGQAVGRIQQALNAKDLMMNLPSLFNESEVLVNIYAILVRTDNVVTPVVNLRHARLVRMDNVDAEGIVTYGSEQWKCFPWFSRNLAQRNGVPWSTGAEHSGTFGFAYRYPGA